MQASKSSFSVEAHRIHNTSTPSNELCKTCEVLSTREAGKRLNAQGFHWGLVTLAPNEIQTSKRKAGIQHKPHSLYKQFRHNEPPLSVSTVETLLKSKFPDAKQGPVSQAGLSEERPLCSLPC